jgi:hypothetical protein
MTEPAEPGKDTDTITVQHAPSDQDDFLSNLLAPGSSLNPTFLVVVDGVLALLALTLVSLVIATGGNVHLIALLVIELALWVSIKWWGKIPIIWALLIQQVTTQVHHRITKDGVCGGPFITERNEPGDQKDALITPQKEPFCTVHVGAPSPPDPAWPSSS